MKKFWDIKPGKPYYFTEPMRRRVTGETLAHYFRFSRKISDYVRTYTSKTDRTRFESETHAQSVDLIIA